MPDSLTLLLSAFIPIAMLIIMLIFLHYSATKAAMISLLLTVLSALFMFKASLSTVFIEAGKGLWNGLSILMVILSAVSLYEVTAEAKITVAFKQGINKISSNELIQILLIGCVFTSYLQGITGFGVPIVVGAPLLRGIGVKPVYAVVISIIGYAWANTYGTLAAAWDSLVQTVGISVNSTEFYQLSYCSTLFLVVVNLAGCLVICWLYGRTRALKKGWLAILVMVLSQSIGQIICGQFNTTVAAFLPTTFSLLTITLLSRMKMYNSLWRIEDSKIMDRKNTEEKENCSMTFIDSLFPYIVLTLITFVCLLIKPVNNFLSIIKISISFPATLTGYGFKNEAINNYSPISIFTHPSVFLLLSAIISYIYYRKKQYIVRCGYKTIIKTILRKVLPSVITVSSLLMMSKIMSGTGQTTVLAETTAKIFKEKYPYLTPFIGLIGAFITGSNMSSNILFGKFQQITAQMLGLNEDIILAAQTSGAAIGGVTSPSNITLATTTVGIAGSEGEVLKKTTPVALIVSLIISMLANAFV
ncbi:MAG: L-lactate permease [Erysipelotrichia bacterium]|nr:L-lactate permease [Erysipelotrichia bacterium]